MAISLKSMRYFNTALAHGSIAKAAEELNIAASAVSAAIDQVEDTFNLTLVTRQRSRGIMANASGRLISKKFESLLEDYQSILEDGEDLKHSLGGSLRVGYYAPVAPAFLPRVFSTFLPADAEVVLYLEESDNDSVQDGLLAGQFDVVLFVSEGARASVRYEVLVEAPPYCLLPAAHPLGKQKDVSLAEIAREKLVVLDRPVAGAYYHRLFEGFEPGPKIAAYANSTEMVRSLVGSGQGCAVLNMRPSTSTSYGADELVSLPISDQLPALTLAIAYDRTKPRRIVQLFVDACRTYFAVEGLSHCVAQTHKK